MYFGIGPFGFGMGYNNGQQPPQNQQQNNFFNQQQRPQQQQQQNRGNGLFDMFNDFMNPFMPNPRNQQQ